MTQRKIPAPLFYPALLWCLGIWLGKALGAEVLFWAVLAGLLLLAAIVLPRARLWLLLALCVVLGGWRWQSAQRLSPLDAVFTQKNHIQQNAVFRVTKLLSRQAGVYEIRLDSLGGVEVREPLLLTSEEELRPGREYSALLEVVPGKKDPVLDTFPARNRAYIRQNLQEVPGKGKLLPIAAWRASLLKNLDAKLGPEAAFAKALLFSDTSSQNAYREQLTRSGTIHLIVVSGLHIWFIYGLCMVLLNALLPRQKGEAVFLLLIGLYAALNHWSPSVVRSVLMIGLLIVGRWRSIPLAREQLLALSLLIITAVSPGQLFNIGLQLSFLCIGVIMLGLPKVEWLSELRVPDDRRRRWLNGAIDLLVMNIAIGVAITPLTLYYFGTASLNGIIGNLLGVPLSGLLLGVCFLILFVPGGNIACTALVNSYRVILYLFEFWTALVAKLPFYLENMWLNHWQLLGSALIVLVGLWCFRRLKAVWRMAPAFLAGLALLFLPVGGFRREGGIYVFNAGTADCLLACFPDGTRIMVDTGPKTYNSETSWAERKLLPWARKAGVKRLDWLVLTHLDADHSGGFADIVSVLQPENVIISDETRRDSLWATWERSGLLRGTRIYCVVDTVSYVAGPARLKFLHPDGDYFSESSNGSSLVFRMDYQDKRYLFTGDADTDAEAHLLASYPAELEADCLKAGHHGSRSSNSDAFVQAVRPREVWITASARNRWDFPHPEPLQSFRRYGAKVRSTAAGTFFVPFGQK